MTSEGWGRDWTDGTFRGALYINGEYLPAGGVALQKVPQPSHLFAIKTHANTDVLQRLYHGAEAPRLRRGYDITGKFQVYSQELAEKLRECESLGTYFLFAPLDRVTDVFDAVNGESYKLVRPLASSVVSGVSESTHPTKILLDGVEDPTAATITGQTVDANETGVITIHYTPVYKVRALMVEDFPKFNGYDVNFTFSETVRVG